MPDSSRFTRISTLARRPLQAVLLGMAAALLAHAAHAAQISEGQLAAVPMASGSASFVVDGVPGLVLTVTEQTGTTMQGSDLADSAGLWLGAEGGGGRYQFALSAPVTQVSLRFVALTTLGPDGIESLTALTSDRPTRIQLDSFDASVVWDGNTVTPLAEDGRGGLQWVATTPEGFSLFGFDHHQPVMLQGWVIQQIGLTPLSPVPEPAPAALLMGGGLALWVLRRRLPG